MLARLTDSPVWEEASNAIGGDPLSSRAVTFATAPVVCQTTCPMKVAAGGLLAEATARLAGG